MNELTALLRRLSFLRTCVRFLVGIHNEEKTCDSLQTVTAFNCSILFDYF